LEGIATSLYLFYGKNISYFFVDEIPDDELKNPNDDYSVLESKSQLSFNPMGSHIVNRMEDKVSTMSRSKSYIYKQNEPTVFSDKAMQLKHKGLTIRQIIVGQIEYKKTKQLRKNSSNSTIRDNINKSVSNEKKFHKVLLILEKGRGVSNGILSYSLYKK
jgi:hypothetical protein